MIPAEEGSHRGYARLKKFNIAGGGKVRASALTAIERKLAGTAQTRNKGFIFSSEKAFAVGDIVRLLIKMEGLSGFKGERSALDNDTVSVLGKVVLVELCPDGFFEIGLCLINLDRGCEMLLRHRIASLHAALDTSR